MKFRCMPFVFVAVLAAPALAAEPSMTQEQYADQIKALLPGMGADNITDRQKPQQALEKLCHQAGAPDRQADRAALSKAIMGLVGPETAKPARVWLLRKIEPLGREEVVEGLARLMHDADPEIADLARRALANNPSDQASAALRAELAATGKPEWKVAVINALAWRHDAGSAEALAKLAEEKGIVGAAAISALGEVVSDETTAKLAELRKSAPADQQATVVDASLRAAERLLAAGKAPAAKAIYEDLLAPARPENVRVAAITGLAGVPDDATFATLLKHATGDDAHLRQIAAQCLARVRGPNDATRRITTALKAAAPDAKILLIDALGQRGDALALPSVMQYMEDKDADLRLAAYEAIGKLGSAPTVRVLIVQGAKSEGRERDVIRNSLANLKGPGVDDGIVKTLPTSEGAMRVELIMAVWGRRIAAAKPIILDMADDGDENVRVAVLTALERLANEADLPRLVELLASARGDACANAAEVAIASVCRRAGDPEKCVPPLVAAMAKATSAGKVAIVKQLAKVQGAEALEAVRSAAKSDDAKVREAAQAAIAQWKPIYITAWQFAGPFREEGKGPSELFNVVFPPEQATAAAKWAPLRSGNRANPGRFDLARVAKGDNCCVYVKTAIQSKQKQDAILSIGTDDGVKVWLNGKMVHENNVTRALKCDEDQVKISLNEGENTLLLKITQGGAQFEFCCGIKGADGGPPEGVRFEGR